MSSFFNTRIFLSAAIIAFGFLFSFFIIVSAQINPFDIQFPVSELGNCGSTQECKIYCDDPANARACTDWAVSKGFAQSSPKNEYQEKSSINRLIGAPPGYQSDDSGGLLSEAVRKLSPMNGMRK